MVTTQAESGFDIKRLKELRAKAGLTQKDLAARARVSHITICLYENGKVPRPRASVVGRIAAALSACGTGGGMYADGLRRAGCPHCGAPNCHALEVCIPGVELQCISCGRVFRLDAKGRAYIPGPVPGRGEKRGVMSDEGRENISAGQLRRHARERAEEEG